MARLFLGLIALTGGLVMAGCSQDVTAHEPLAKQTVQLMNQLADEMEGMMKKPNPKALQESALKIKKLSSDLEELGRKIKALPASTQNALDRKFKTEIEQAKTRVEQAGTKMGIPMPKS